VSVQENRRTDKRQATFRGLAVLVHTLNGELDVKCGLARLHTNDAAAFAIHKGCAVLSTHSHARRADVDDLEGNHLRAHVNGSGHAIEIDPSE